MKDKRQGNDLKVAWSIFMQDGEPFRLDGKDVSLYLKNMFGRKELNDFVTTGNIIQWTFYGKDQKNTGKYSLELVINEGEKGMITTDKCDFVNLVSCSCKLQGGEDAPNVETESIELTSTLEYVAGGGDYDDTALWKELENKVDKEEGKGLSTNDYTTAEKNKLASLENYEDSGLLTKLTQLENAKASKEDVEELVEELEINAVLIEDLQNTKIDKEADDYYPQLSVGLADNLAGVDVVASEVSFRRSGGSAISDGVARIEAIKGNSVVWNQKLPKKVGWLATDGTSYVYDDVADEYTITSGKYLNRIETPTNITKGHKYIVCYDVKVNTSSSYEGTYYIGYIGPPTQWFNKVNISNAINKWYRHIEIFTVSADQSRIFLGLYDVISLDSQDTQSIRHPRLIDLTLMFGVGNEPTTIEEFNARKPLGIDENAYTEGEVIHMNAQSLVSCNVDSTICKEQSLDVVRKYFLEGMKSSASAHDEIRYNKATQKWEKVEAIGVRAYQDGDADNTAYLTDGTVTCYPLAEPIVTEIEGDFNLDYEVWNGGTEKIVSDVPTAPLKADIAYGFNAVGKIKENSQQLTELSAEVSGKQDTISDLENIRSGAARGATALQSVPDTYATKQYVDNAIKDIPAPTPSASNEWKCVFDGRMEAGKSSIICTTFADGTPLNAREAIIEVTNDIKAADDITGYVRIQSTLNKNKCSFGIITYESASVGDGKIMVQDVRLETSEHFFTKVYIAKDMKNSIAQNSPVGEEIGHNPQIFEDIVSIELASNLLLTEAAPLVKIYAR